MPLPFCDHAADAMRLVEIQISIFMMRFAALSLAAVLHIQYPQRCNRTGNVCFLVPLVTSSVPPFRSFEFSTLRRRQLKGLVVLVLNVLRQHWVVIFLVRLFST
jgi:hypothetical protein